MKLTDFEPVRLDELAPATLASYKTKAGAAATAADAAGDVKTADKRFSGIVKATKKQFDQDAKGVAEGEYDSRKPFGVRYKVFAGREGRMTTREYWTSSEEKLQRAVDKIQALDNFYEIDGYSYPKESQGVAEDNDALAAFLARGGEVQQLKPQRGPRRSGVSFASKHIGSASGRGNTKGKVSGLGANTGKSGKPVVTAEQGITEVQLDELFEPSIDYYTLSNGKMVQVDYKPGVDGQGPAPFTDVNVSYVNPALKPQGPSFDSTGQAQRWDRAPDGIKQAIQKFITQPQSVLEMDKSQTPPGRDGDLRSGPDREAKPISKEKMNKDAADVLGKAMSKEHEKKDVAEDSISAMRRLAGIVPRVPSVVSNGQRQYRRMPTAVQPR